LRKDLSAIPLVFLLGFVLGRQDKAATAEPEEPKSQAALEDRNKAWLSRLIELESKGKSENLGQFYSMDCMIHIPGGDDELL
jgi:hypothetical protein